MAHSNRESNQLSQTASRRGRTFRLPDQHRICPERDEKTRPAARYASGFSPRVSDGNGRPREIPQTRRYRSQCSGELAIWWSIATTISDFAETDRDGFACPVGSHIRRANPRDALAFPAEPGRSLAIANRHRIMRRGRPYHETSTESGKVIEQGLLFIAINASLQRQFEFIQQLWLNNPKFNGLYDERDPLSSANPGDGTLTIQSNPVRERAHGLPRFVTVRGGAYFFLPSIRALKFLAQIR